MRKLRAQAVAVALLSSGAGWADAPAPAAPAPAVNAPVAAPSAAPVPAVPSLAPAAKDPLELDAPLPPELEQDRGNLLMEVVRMLVALGVVMALIYITLNYGLRRMLGLRLPNGRKLLSVVERVPLDAKRSLVVVQVAGEYLLVGTADGAVSLLSKLDSEAVERLQRERREAAPVPNPNSLWFKLLSRRGGSASGPEGSKS